MRAFLCVIVLLCAAAPLRAQEAPVLIAPPVVAPAPHKNRFFAKIALGYAGRVALDESLHAASAQLTLGAQNEVFGGGARLDVDAGRTAHGLVFTTVGVGPDFDFRLHERVRLSFGTSFGALTIQRVTEKGALSSFLFGAYLEPAFDLVKGDEGSAFYVAPRVALEVLDTTGLPPVGLLAQLALGYRY